MLSHEIQMLNLASEDKSPFRFHVGQVVWTMRDNLPAECVIVERAQRLGPRHRVSSLITMYTLVEVRNMHEGIHGDDIGSSGGRAPIYAARAEDDIFPSREAMRDSLFPEVIPVENAHEQ